MARGHHCCGWIVDPAVGQADDGLCGSTIPATRTISDIARAYGAPGYRDGDENDDDDEPHAEAATTSRVISSAFD